MSRYTDGNTPLLSDSEMTSLGFLDRNDEFWYFCKGILYSDNQRSTSVTLNISIEKSTGNYAELVMNEMFGQPEYYGNMKEPYRTNVISIIDAELKRMNEAGLNIQIDHTLYEFKRR